MDRNKRLDAFFTVFRDSNSGLMDVEYDIDMITEYLTGQTDDKSLTEISGAIKMLEFLTILLTDCVEAVVAEKNVPAEYYIGFVAASLAGNLGIIDNSIGAVHSKALTLEPDIGQDKERVVSIYAMSNGELQTKINPHIGEAIADDDVSEDRNGQWHYGIETLACSIASIAAGLVESGEPAADVVANLMVAISDYLTESIPEIEVTSGMHIDKSSSKSGGFGLRKKTDGLPS